MDEYEIRGLDSLSEGELLSIYRQVCNAIGKKRESRLDEIQRKIRILADCAFSEGFSIAIQLGDGNTVETFDSNTIRVVEDLYRAD